MATVTKVTPRRTKLPRLLEYTQTDKAAVYVGRPDGVDRSPLDRTKMDGQVKNVLVLGSKSRNGRT